MQNQGYGALLCMRRLAPGYDNLNRFFVIDKKFPQKIRNIEKYFGSENDLLSNMVVGKQ